MTHRISQNFPSVVPMEELQIESEPHTFAVVEYEDGTVSAKEEYVPNKSPFIEISEVRGIVNGNETLFSEGDDYRTVDTDNDGRLEAIRFDTGGKQPDANTTFEITYTAYSVIFRYVQSYQDEFDILTNNLETVIDSHHVNEVSGTGTIDSFTDQEIVEYTVTAGDESNVYVQNTVAVDEWALALDPSDDNNVVEISSQSGLLKYPIRGDTIAYSVQLSDTAATTSFDFLRDDESDEFYSVTVAGSGELSLRKDTTKTATTSVSLNEYIGSWLRVEVTIESLGLITASLFAPDDSLIGETTITDTEYTDGSIRWRANTDTVYIDTASVTQRNSQDLDRIGALFGQLGRRRGRPDSKYRAFLRSIVQSFGGRGTVDGIRFSVSSGIDTDDDNITLVEDFERNEYVVMIHDWTDHSLSTVYDLAEIADPSGVIMADVEYDIPDQNITFTDDITTESGSVDIGPDANTSSDTVAVTTNPIEWDGDQWDTLYWDE